MNNISISKTEILKEIGNIGTGNAATALSQIINKTVKINIPDVEFLDINTIVNGFSAKNGGVLVSIILKEAIKGNVFIRIDDESSEKLHKAASQGFEIEKNQLLLELSNILTGSYVNALASLMDAFVNISPPEICGSNFDVSTLIDFTNYASEVAFIKTAMIINEEKIFCDFILMMEPASLKFLLERVVR